MNGDWKDNQKIVVFAALITIAILLFGGAVLGVLLNAK